MKYLKIDNLKKENPEYLVVIWIAILYHLSFYKRARRGEAEGGEEITKPLANCFSFFVSAISRPLEINHFFARWSLEKSVENSSRQTPFRYLLFSNGELNRIKPILVECQLPYTVYQPTSPIQLKLLADKKRPLERGLAFRWFYLFWLTVPSVCWWPRFFFPQGISHLYKAIPTRYEFLSSDI